MKNIITLIFVAIMVASCGSTKEVEGPSANESKPAPISSEVKRQQEPKLNPEQIAAKLGLSEEKEIAFLEMWDATDKEMKAAREENKGNRDALRKKMMEIRDARENGLKTILSEEELAKYYEIMEANRRKAPGAFTRRGGN